MISKHIHAHSNYICFQQEQRLKYKLCSMIVQEETSKLSEMETYEYFE